MTSIITLPFRTTYYLYNIGLHNGWTSGIAISISDISMISLCFYNYVKNQHTNLLLIKNLPILLLFIFSCTLSIFNSKMGMATACQIIMITQLGLLYYCVLYQAIESDKDIGIIINGLLMSLYLQSILSISQYFTGNSYDLFSTGVKFDFADYDKLNSLTRVLGTIGKPNGLAAYIVPIILINITILFYENNNKKITICGIILGCITLLLTFSRGGWLSFIIALFILIYMLYKRNIIKIKNILFVTVILFVFVLIFYGNIEKRIYGDDYNAAASRIPLIKIALNMIDAHPFIGIGTNTFRNEILNYAIGPEFIGVYLYEVHNQFLLVFAEAGIVGLIFFLLLYKYAFKECKICINANSNNRIKGLCFGIYVGIIASMIHMNVDLSNSNVHIGSFFVYFAIVSVLSNKSIKYI